MEKTRTFYKNSGDVAGSDLTKAFNYASQIDTIFDVTKVTVLRKKNNSWDNYHTEIKINFK